MSGTATTTQLTMDQARVSLNAVASTLKIVRTSPLRTEPGNPLTASLVPASPLIDASELANGVLNIAWTAKDLIFRDAAAVNVPTSGDLDGMSLRLGPMS